MGCFFSWLGQILLYGYGQLIENSDKLVLLQMGESGKKKLDLDEREESNTASIRANSTASQIGKCDVCGKENVSVSKCTIKDDFGTRYRNLCEECSEKSDIIL